MTQIYVCPVCRQDTKRTMRGNIAVHLDSVRRDTCPAGGYPIHIALVVTPEYHQLVSA